MGTWWKGAEAPQPASTARAGTPPPADWLRLNGHNLYAGLPPGPSPPDQASPSKLPLVPGYELLDVLGRGGVGVVYRARDLNLGRVVALKMLLAGAHGDPDSLQRFRTEAEAIAQLQHPNIVQIYDIGTADGLPYLALEYVKGQSLDAKLREGPQPPEAAARLVETLARAVHTAHEHGIIHRDLKPANVLLAPDGTPKIVDFGLAKRLDTITGLTRSGAFLGTPAYMAPEQLSHGTDVGPACDVYALGVVLYEMLAGRPPFEAGNPADLLFQVNLRDPIPPGYWHPALPDDLEAVCLRCLQKGPRDRYPNAAALADDLRRYLEGRPVEARRRGEAPPARHWLRRRLVWAALAAAALVGAGAGVALLGTGYFRPQAASAPAEEKARPEHEAAQARARAETEQLRQEAEESREREARRTRGLRVALEALTSPQVEDLLVRQPERGKAGKEFLRGIREQLEGFAADAGDGVEARTWLGLAFYRLGSVRGRVGEHAEAEAALRQASDLFERLAAEQSASAELQHHGARALTALGGVLLDRGERDEAEAKLKQAQVQLTKLIGEQPGTTGYLETLGATNQTLCQLLRGVGRGDKALDECRGALALAQDLDPGPAARPRFRHFVAQQHAEMGRLLRERQQWDQAEKHLRQAVALLAPLVEKYPNVVDYRRSLAAARENLGLTLARLKPEVAEPEQRRELLQALELRKQIAAEFPAVPEYRHELAGAHFSLAVWLRGRGKRPEAATESQRAAALGQRLVADHPGMAKYAETLAGAHWVQGQLHAQDGRHDDAVDACGQAVSLLRPLVDRDGQDAVARLLLTFALGSRATSLAALDRHADAAQDWQQLAPLAEGRNRVSVLHQAAEAWLRAGDHARAFAAVSEAAKNKEARAADHYRLAGVCAQASALARADASLREQYARQAVALLTQALRAGYFKEPKYAERLRKDAVDGGLAALRERGDFKALLEKLPPPPPMPDAKPGPDRPLAPPAPER